MSDTHIWTDLAKPFDESADDAVEAHLMIQRRLDGVVPGEWDFTLTPLPERGGAAAFIGRLQILGVIREAVGVGTSYTDANRAAFSGAAGHYGIFP